MSDFKLYNDIPRMMPSPAAPANAPANPASFGKLLNEAIQQVNDVHNSSTGELQKFLGNESDLHSVMIALEKADLSFQMMMQVRNKIVSAYQEIMKSQV
jgi:flagellar hook-basal body complex protein FliE